MNEFELTIKAFLDKKAADDSAFAAKYSNPDKSIEDCCKYIIEQVRKTRRSGFTDPEIYGMAIHYYDESSIKAPDTVPQYRVVVNRDISLSDEDKARLRLEAEKKFLDDEMKALQARKAREDNRKKARLEELRREDERQGTLF